MLKVKQLSKKKILEEIDFEIDSGEIAIFLGESGAGKTTILRILNHLESFDHGTFSLDGVCVDLKKANQTNTVGMVFQHLNLFDHLTAEENILYPLTHCKGLQKHQAKTIVEKLLARYELQEKSTMCISQLSGGQKQRLAIARTLATNPKIICFDEPTSALDPRLTMQIAQLITELAKENRIVLLTTHDLHLLEHLDGKIFFVERGRIVERGSKQECMSNPHLYPKIHSFLNIGNRFTNRFF